MYHSLAYTLLIGTVADTDVPALQDDEIAIQNTHFILPSLMKLMAAIVYSPTLVRAQLVSPTLRQTNPVFLRGTNLSAIAVVNPAVFYPQPNFLKLAPFEEVQILGTAAPATTERFTAVLFAGDGNTALPTGDVYPVRWTSTGTAVANAWTTIAYGLPTVIPSGIYTMVQSEHGSTNAIAHRWIFSNMPWRPGFPSQTSEAGRLPDQMQVNWFGAMGVFRSNDLPRLQVLCNAGDAAHAGYMWLIRTGNLS